MSADTATFADIDSAFSYFGLETTASLVAVKEAFRRYAKQFHPDKFPAGSDEQAVATEKMIAANSYFDNLKAFFEEYPEGKPQEEGQSRNEPEDDSDWEAWERKRYSAFDDELAAWKARQASHEGEKESSREGFRRKKLVRYCRYGLILLLAVMWIGWFSANGKLAKDARYQQNSDAWVESKTNNDDTHKLWMSQHQQYRENYQDKLDKQPINGLFLLLFSAGAGWVLLSKQGRAFVENYLSGGKA